MAPVPVGPRAWQRRPGGGGHAQQVGQRSHPGVCINANGEGKSSWGDRVRHLSWSTFYVRPLPWEAGANDNPCTAVCKGLQLDCKFLTGHLQSHWPISSQTLPLEAVTHTFTARWLQWERHTVSCGGLRVP